MELIITKDKADLERLEGIIHKNLQSFYEVGRALMEIRDKELYKIKNGGEYGTFEAYCRAVWDFTRIRAYQLIESVAVRENLLTQVNIEPKSEKQIRPLVKLKADQQREAWQKAVDTAPDGKVTASHVYKIVKEMSESNKTIRERRILNNDASCGIDSGFEKAWNALLEEIKNIKALKFKTIPKDKAIKKIQILIDVLEL
jgi:hypothetical protein